MTGSNEGTGDETSPLKTVSKALELHGESIKVIVKKDADGYPDVSGAAFKKAKKSLFEQQRKLKKQEEQKGKYDAKTKEMTDEEAKDLEHAKSIVLTQDESLPKANKVSGT